MNKMVVTIGDGIGWDVNKRVVSCSVAWVGPKIKE